MYGFRVNADIRTIVSRNRRLFTGFYYVSINLISRCLEATTFEQKVASFKNVIFIFFSCLCDVCGADWGEVKVCMCVCSYVCRCTGVCGCTCMCVHVCLEAKAHVVSLPQSLSTVFTEARFLS